jgi:hypothetical protein
MEKRAGVKSKASALWYMFEEGEQNREPRTMALCCAETEALAIGLMEAMREEGWGIKRSSCRLESIILTLLFECDSLKED